ncbi:peroxiredoxin (alkyl hydroperoxide reductase subunit C) [Desulfosporosinus hippei DSM 8344]|uniref:Peroxiredoxin (Alkyl hydroperoxide reductase subunit C) n=2 Tax=Desulfosporosinus TaxID=79206 RepID=A0A1G8LWF0_9FIRM|nr:peroxiredoxin (alkyl hydroperoxide reductase subunit C) [Desulfosporosinus hippei DSM 8344]
MICPEQLAPDFETEAYVRGKKVNVHLNDFIGQWILLIFYASDFTFV